MGLKEVETEIAYIQNGIRQTLNDTVGIDLYEAAESGTNPLAEEKLDEIVADLSEDSYVDYKQALAQLGVIETIMSALNK